MIEAQSSSRELEPSESPDRRQKNDYNREKRQVGKYVSPYAQKKEEKKVNFQMTLNNFTPWD
jgi:hypothetical protein